jgi:hypothetical protein
MALLRLRVRQRRRIVLVTLLCLLFQQLAMAAYACPLTQMPLQAKTTPTQCDAMGMVQKALPSPALCYAHCNPDTASTVAAHISSVPALGLPPPVFARVITTRESTLLRLADVPLHRSDPPPMLRFCSLLI